MALVRRSPTRFPSWGNFFETDPFMDWMESVANPWNGHSTPASNVKETDDTYEVEVAAPGMERDDFDINIENGVLIISAEREESDEEKEANYTRREYNYNSFSRTFQLPESVKEDDIKAKYEDGILRLTIPKKEEAKTSTKKKIEIQ